MTSSGPQTPSDEARELRRAFDATFALAPPPAPRPTAALLLVRAGGELIALRRDETIGFVRGEAIVPTPGRSPAFLGLAGLRRGVFPVWSLAGLLGGVPAPRGAKCWLVLAQKRADAPCAFACETFEQMIPAEETALALTDGAGRTVIPWGAARVPIADLNALQSEIWARMERTRSTKQNP